MLELYLLYSQTRLFLLHADKVSDAAAAAAAQETDDMEPESKKRKTDNGKMWVGG